MERLLADAEELSGQEYDISNLGDVYSAIHVIQEELGLTGVAAGEAETTLTGSLNSVKASWENVMAALTTGEGLDTAMENLKSSVSNFADNVLRMLSNLGPQIPTLILGLLDTLIENAPELAAGGAEMIAQLAVGLIESIPKLIEKVPEIFTNVAEAFAEVDWASLGKDLIAGVINGVVSAASKLYEKIREIIRNALGAGQSEAEVGSPSRLFAREIGRWIPPGIGLGAEQNAETLNNSVRRIVDGSVSAARIPSVRPVSAGTANDADRIIDALRSLTVDAHVKLEGDAGKIFRVIRDVNNTRTRATRYNALAAGGV